MNKPLLILIVLTALLLSACVPANIPPSDPTSQTSQTTAGATQPPTSTAPAVPDYTELIALIEDEKSWYSFALTDRFDAPENMNFYYFLYTELEPFSFELTKEEQSLLQEAFPDLGDRKVARISAAAVDELLTQCFGLTLDKTSKNGMSNFVYLKETDSYYRYEDSTVNRFAVDSVEENDNGTVSVYYGHLASTKPKEYVAVFQPHEEGYWLRSNSRYADTTGKTEEQIEMDALFQYYDKHPDELWYSKALTCDYTTPADLRLRYFFDGGFSHNDTPTAEEWDALKNKPGFNENYGFYRLPVAKMDEKLQEYFGITLEQMNPAAFANLEYLESTNCYYFMATAPILYLEDFAAEKVEKQSDGTIHLYYSAFAQDDHLAVLKPTDGGYQILSNVPVPPDAQTTDPTIPLGDVDPELFADLTAKFGELCSWYNMALTCEYASPAELDLKMFFYNGFKDEVHRVTDQEYPLLKALLNNPDNLDRMDLVRLPVSKMDAVLTECFGIQTKDVNENGMLYLEETDCYYMLLNAAHYMSGHEFTGAEKLEDGSIRIFYTVSKKAYAVTLKPTDDGYIIWSNLPV